MLASSFYISRPWRTVRGYALERDGFRCTVEEPPGERCPETVGLHVHHLDEPRDELDPLALDLANLLTVCGSHHSVWHALRRGTARCVRMDTDDRRRRRSVRPVRRRARPARA